MRVKSGARARALVAIAALAAAARLGAACVIELDPPLGDDEPSEVRDASVTDATLTDAPVTEDAGIECVANTDCRADGPGASCLTPSCVDGRCVFELCPVADPCLASRCDLTMGCGTPEPLSFLAGTVTVPAPDFATLDCRTLARCTAVSDSFVFVVEGVDIAAYHVPEPFSTPRRLHVSLPFRPTQIVASGPWLYAIGPVAGGTNPVVDVAWIEVPTNPLATTLTATTRLLRYNAQNTTAAPVGFAAPGGGLYLSTAAREIYLLTPEIEQNGEMLFRPASPTRNVTLAVPAGDKIVGATHSAVSGTSSFAVLYGPGSPAPSFGDQFALRDLIGAIASSQIFLGGGPAGDVVASAGVGTGSDASTAEARVVWLLEPGADAGTDASVSLVVANYAPVVPPRQRVVGPVVGVDGGALVAFVDRAANVTVVEAVHRDGGDGNPAVDPTRKVTLPAPVAPSSELSSSRDWTYLLTSPESGSMSIRVFRPACEERDR